MSDEIRANISAMAKALCYYPSGPSNVNSCCPGIGRCEMDAAIAEIARLRAELATARREGMEHVRTRILWHQKNHYLNWRELRAFDTALEIIRKEIDAIRAAAKDHQP
jgi:hypothetical protein